MGKSTNFLGQPLLCQLLKFFDKDKILRLSRKMGGERYVKSFDGWHHLVVMLYAVIMRFDSLREITASTLAEARKLNHLGITTMPRCHAARRSLMPTHGVLRRSSKPFTAICWPRTAICFQRTAGAAPCPPGSAVF